MPKSEKARSAQISFVEIDYTNWRGERSNRTIVPLSLKFGANKWHPVEQWFILATDVNRRQNRWFAMTGIHSWKSTHASRRE